MKSKKLCRQCFRPNHFVSECFRKYCKECGGRHHTLLHRSSIKSTLGTEQKLEKDQVEPKESRAKLLNQHRRFFWQLVRTNLQTADVKVMKGNTKYVYARIYFV